MSTEQQIVNDDKRKSCEVCGANPFKYKCPRCEVHTCSLQCVNLHKKELTCTGERDPTTYVPMSKFTNLDLLSDYRFLEDIDRAINNCRRNPQKRYTRYQQPLPTHLYRLKSAAARRRISIQFLPQHFTRHQDNNTILDYKTQEISWKLDIIFPQGDMIKICETVNEKMRLSAVIDKYLNPVHCPEKFKNYLRFYHSAGISDTLILLKAERSKDPNAVYILDMFSDINTNLTNRIIIENPILIVIKKSFKDEYTILDKDVEEEFSDSIKGKKTGFFGDFSPVGYFDCLDQKPKKPNKGDAALQSIHESTFALRGRRPIREEPEESEEEEEPFRRPNVEIPTYEKLCNT